MNKSVLLSVVIGLVVAVPLHAMDFGALREAACTQDSAHTQQRFFDSRLKEMIKWVLDNGKGGIVIEGKKTVFEIAKMQKNACFYITRDDALYVRLSIGGIVISYRAAVDKSLILLLPCDQHEAEEITAQLGLEPALALYATIQPVLRTIAEREPPEDLYDRAAFLAQQKLLGRIRGGGD